MWCASLHMPQGGVYVCFLVSSMLFACFGKTLEKTRTSHTLQTPSSRSWNRSLNLIFSFLGFLEVLCMFPQTTRPSPDVGFLISFAVPAVPTCPKKGRLVAGFANATSGARFSLRRQ